MPLLGGVTSVAVIGFVPMSLLSTPFAAVTSSAVFAGVVPLSGVAALPMVTRTSAVAEFPLGSTTR